MRYAVDDTVDDHFLGNHIRDGVVVTIYKEYQSDAFHIAFDLT